MLITRPVVGCSTLNVADLIGETEALAVHHALARSTLDAGVCHGTFHQVFGDLLLFVYHCFDRIVIHGYLSGLSRPEQVVHFSERSLAFLCSAKRS